MPSPATLQATLKLSLTAPPSRPARAAPAPGGPGRARCRQHGGGGGRRRAGPRGRQALLAQRPLRRLQAQGTHLGRRAQPAQGEAAGRWAAATKPPPPESSGQARPARRGYGMEPGACGPWGAGATTPGKPLGKPLHLLLSAQETGA